MEKLNLIKTLAGLCINLAETTIKRLDDRYVVDSNYNHGDSYFQYDVCYYNFIDAEVDLDGNIISAVNKYGQEFWNGGGEMSEETVIQLGDPDWKLINNENVMQIVFNRADEILSLKPGEEIKITYEDCVENRRRNAAKEEV